MPESESSPPRASGLQVELGAKPRFRLRAIWLVASLLLLAAVAFSVTLVARPPTASPNPHLPTATSLQPKGQPRITWSENQIEVILSPGESLSRDLAFTSTLDVQNIVIEPVPTLAPFVSIQSNSFASVPAGQQQSVTMTFSIPPGATLGTYDGTVHIRLGSQTLPQTLKISLNIWNAFVDFGLGLQLKYPPNWQASTSAMGVSLSTNDRQQIIDNSDENDTPPEIGVVVLPNPSSVSVDDFASDYQRGWYGTYAASFPLSVDGRAAIRFTDVNVALGHAPCQAVFIQHDSSVVLVTLNDYCPNEAAAVFDAVLTSIRF